MNRLINKSWLLWILFLFCACESAKVRETQSNQTKKIFVYGHRGSRGTHPENTLPAFKEAVEGGADVLHLDLHLSSDGVLVVSHEPLISDKLCRQANGKPIKKPLLIRRLTAVKIATYDCGSNAQAKFPDQKLISKTPIPTFEQILGWLAKDAPQVGLSVEIKMEGVPRKSKENPSQVITKKIIQTLKKYNLIDGSILQSFDLKALEAAKEIEPKLRRSCLFENEKNFCELTEKTGCQIASPRLALLTRSTVKACHESGIQIVPGIANSQTEWKKLVDAGVDGILTDYPRKLAQFLKE